MSQPPHASNPPAEPRILQVRNPRTGQADYQIKVCSTAELETMAMALRAAQPDWRSRGLAERIQVLQRWSEALEQSSPDVIEALAGDTGRQAISEAEVKGLLGAIQRWTLQAPDLLKTEARDSVVFPHIRLDTQLVPFPLVGVISPWNFPLTLSFIDAIPALLAGCSVLIKPSEVTPRFVEPVAASLAAVPELARVLRFATGDGETGAALIQQVDAVAFTGSVATGRKVGQAAAAAFIPAFLELGGKDPALVLDDADLERASTALLRGSVQATGQACQSIERIYVHQSIFPQFVDRLVEKARQVRLTHPELAGNVLGPLIFDRQADIIRRHLDDAVERGARIRCGGEILDLGGGLWLEPTVLTDVNHDMLVMTEETFGPVMPVMAFADDDQAVALANDTEFGLSGCVFSQDLDRARRIAEQIDAGGISINDAALTAMVHEIEKNSFRRSGLGASRMGPTGLLRFLRHKAMYINQGEVVPIEALTEK